MLDLRGSVGLICCLVASSCAGKHPDHLVEVTASAPCATCHLADYQKTDHQATGKPTTCEDCHHSTTSWGAAATVENAHDPAHDVTITALIPSYLGTSIVDVAAVTEVLQMTMSHTSPDVGAATLGQCSACHAGAASGRYFPGVFHASLAALRVAQVTRCVSCHAPTVPAGFVGPPATSPERAPSSGEMKHDAVLWSQDRQTGTAVVTQDCGTCHTSVASWQAGVYHAALSGARQPQPSSCLDCHANTRPRALLTYGNSSLPANVKIDHTTPEALGDCVSCHAGTATWSGGRYHLAASAAPASCLPCHADERPTTTAAWTSTTYATVPFDYVTNANGLTHGAAQDCVVCHAGPGAGGAWGGSQTWKGGTFVHGAATLSGTTCISCHVTQRPGLRVDTFDHATDGTGDCFGCHQATVTGGRYASYPDDWKGGARYPGSTPVSAGNGALKPTEWSLVRSSATGLITGMTSSTATLTSSMLHTASMLPAAVDPGPPGQPDNTVCWHCHVSSDTMVTAFAGGQFHARLDTFSATPGGPITPLPQPTSGCAECHAQVRPTGIVERAASSLKPMDHAARFAAPASIGGVLASSVADLDCSTCHRLTTGAWDDGLFHAKIGAATPADCTSCHYPLMADAAAADVMSGVDFSMKHRSVQLTVQSCQTCHADALKSAARTPSAAALWKPGTYHAGLPAGPTSCLDCHASSRPTALLTSANASLPVNVTLDHMSQATMGDCVSCHATKAWSGGRLHLAASTTPGTCLPCHSGERPTTATGWASTTYTRSPFDYGTNSNAVTHGAGRDCVTCHAGPGDGGAWGGSQTWKGGSFVHGPATISGTTCSACHSTQRPGPDQATVLGIDHSTSGTGDCFGCHQDTVLNKRYTNYTNPATGVLPGGDWKGGQFYPGSTVVSADLGALTQNEISLTRDATTGLITGMTAITAKLTSGMLHTATVLPAAVNPGPAATPNSAVCWHCHVSTGTSVTSYLGGAFHAKLDGFTATPGGAITPLPQPTSGCAECHAQVRPTGIVERAASPLAPMDHAARFAAPAAIGGVTASSVTDLDCSVCHRLTKGIWDDGLFHASIGAASPADCTGCHYPAMADASADVTSGIDYSMKHRSVQLTFQSCQTCHALALASATRTPIATALWSPGKHHASLSTQPTACVDCHAGGGPTTATRSAVTYALPLGGTSSNGPQWMSHVATYASGRDCVACHAADARATGSAWSNTTRYHVTASSEPTCQGCHGLQNGNGSTPGLNNNLPAALTSSSTVTTADATTGVPAGTLDQISHTDLNATSHECGFCHTQVGVATAPAIQGKEWAQAKLHASFTSASPLVMNGTTGRCSNCHLNVKPGPSFTFDHSAFTATSAQDCASCHTYPGTGTASAPNWLGAGGAPGTIDVGGFTIPAPPAPSPTLQAGLANLPHPLTGSCTDCHTSAGGGRPATGYDHLSSLISASCNTCHETGSDLLGTMWNGATTVTAGAGDSRPFTLTSVTATYKGNSSTERYANHFYPTDCGLCHVKPAGNGPVMTGTAYQSAWVFKHPPERCANWCLMCHTNGCPN